MAARGFGQLGRQDGCDFQMAGGHAAAVTAPASGRGERGFRRIGQPVAPERFRRCGIGGGQTGDVAAIAVVFAECRRFAVRYRRQGGHDALEHDGHRPAVEQQVMVAPDHLPRCLAEARQRHPHQRGDGGIEAPAAVFRQEAVEFGRLGRRIAPAPVEDRHRHGDGAVDALERPGQTGPCEGGAQVGPRIQHRLPCLRQGFRS